MADQCMFRESKFCIIHFCRVHNWREKTLRAISSLIDNLLQPSRTPWGLQGWEALSPYSLFNSSMKYLGNSNLMHTPELFCRGENHHQVEEINYLMIMNKEPPDLHSMSRIDKVNPCIITLLPYHQPIREFCRK